MHSTILLTDGSVDVKSKTGIGAYILLIKTKREEYEPIIKLQTKIFSHTSSTRLELETFLWAVDEVYKYQSPKGLEIYTDSQNTVGLLARRLKLEKSNFLNKKGLPKKHADLYRTFFLLMDKYPINIHKIKGHNPTDQRTELEQFFGLVDKGAREALRKFVQT